MFFYLKEYIYDTCSAYVSVETTAVEKSDFKGIVIYFIFVQSELKTM